ncbi:putative GNAT family N-acyltransferase [Tumebacillus sp. BK434]|uniref:GNAT family N-acetyltransferase n=1 Tax=Tumebacillus sp. BK434 TaxID=2512169 RepID=UPI001044E5EE|nr:GNAT family N-acetyltransferase [Tumebacillus sp. BK434]TCP52892.1 putative GNAT family N-acyltransferase [Tumebacillus sp. BK434]
MAIHTEQITTEAQYEQALQIRMIVFVQEQNVPPELEVDEHENEAIHVLACDEDGQPVATGRIRAYKDGAGKMERIAVMKAGRGKGYGAAVMHKLEEIGREQGFTSFILEAQTHAEAFYEKLGYRTISDEPFLDAGIWHVRMIKEA